MQPLGLAKRLARPITRPVRERLHARQRRLRASPKHKLIWHYGRTYGLRTLVETGTLFGDTIIAVRRHFNRVYTIELSPDLHAKAKRRLRRFRHVTLLEGDRRPSAPPRPGRAPGDTPALFWLDAHYSAGVTARGPLETPLRAELDLILARGNARDVILVDDATYLSGDRGWPTPDELKELCSAHSFRAWEADGIVRIHR